MYEEIVNEEGGSFTYTTTISQITFDEELLDTSTEKATSTFYITTTIADAQLGIVDAQLGFIISSCFAAFLFLTLFTIALIKTRSHFKHKKSHKEKWKRKPAIYKHSLVRDVTVETQPASTTTETQSFNDKPVEWKEGCHSLSTSHLIYSGPDYSSPRQSVLAFNKSEIFGAFQPPTVEELKQQVKEWKESEDA